MSRSRKTTLVGISRPNTSESIETDTVGYERKIRSLLDTNRLLAKENQFLAQQSEQLRKEHDALGHMMRSRVALSNVKEMELKSALEGMRLVVQEKEKSLVSMEGKYQEILAKMKSLEQNTTKTKSKSNSNRKSYGIRRLSKQFNHVSPPEEEPKKEAHACESPIPDGMTEAYHPWLSPVLMRLENLENERRTSFQGLSRTNFSAMQELEETTEAPETLQFCGLDDAISCTGDCHTPKAQHESEDANDIEFVSRHEASLQTPATAIRASTRRRNLVNYALPSVRSKLRQGDPNTFGHAYEAPSTRRSKPTRRAKK